MYKNEHKIPTPSKPLDISMQSKFYLIITPSYVTTDDIYLLPNLK